MEKLINLCDLCNKNLSSKRCLLCKKDICMDCSGDFKLVVEYFSKGNETEEEEIWEVDSSGYQLYASALNYSIGNSLLFNPFSPIIEKIKNLFQKRKWKRKIGFTPVSLISFDSCKADEIKIRKIILDSTGLRTGSNKSNAKLKITEILLKELMLKNLGEDKDG